MAPLPSPIPDPVWTFGMESTASSLDAALSTPLVRTPCASVSPNTSEDAFDLELALVDLFSDANDATPETNIEQLDTTLNLNNNMQTDFFDHTVPFLDDSIIEENEFLLLEDFQDLEKELNRSVPATTTTTCTTTTTTTFAAQSLAVPAVEPVDPVVANLAARLAFDSEARAWAAKLASGNTEVNSSGAGKIKRKRKPKQPVPEHLKDAKYWRKRERNTILARRYRQEQREMKSKMKAETAAACSKLSQILGAKIM